MWWIILGVIVAILILSEIQIRWKFRSFNRLPGPTSLPIVGSTLYFLADIDKLLSVLKTFPKMYGPISKGCLVREMLILTSDPGMVEFFLNSPKFITKSKHYDFVAPWLGRGMFLSGKHAKELRKLHAPGFHFNIMQSHIAVFNTHCRILIDILRKEADTNLPFNIYSSIGRYALDIITETAAGINTDAQHSGNEEFFNAVHFMTSIGFERSFSIWKRFDLLFYLSPSYYKQRKCIKILDNLAMKAIKERRRLLENNLLDNFENEGEHRHSAMVDNLITGTIDGKPVPDSLLKTETNSLIFAGHDTTAVTMSLAIYAVANHREVQDNIVSELKDIFGKDRDCEVTSQHLSQMRYTEATIKEVLRYYGAVSLVVRAIQNDVDYKGIKIPEGTTMIFNLYGLHHDPSLYENPYEFNPDRFLADKSARMFSFIPFSVGPKNCIGQKYAMNEIKVTLACILRQFEFESAGPEHNVDLRAEMVLKSRNGIHVKIKTRKL